MRHWAALRQPVTAVVLGGARGKESEGKPGTMALERCQSEWDEIEKEYQQLQVRGLFMLIACLFGEHKGTRSCVVLGVTWASFRAGAVC